MTSSTTALRRLKRRQSDPDRRNFTRRLSSPSLTNSACKGRNRRKLPPEHIKHSSKTRTPSPLGTRFDPTAYVEQKKQQQLEIDARLG